MSIRDYSATAGLNTSISGISLAEGMNPSGVNNAFRQLMADIKRAAGGIAFLDDFDAVGDGTTDDTTAVKNAFAASSDSNLVILGRPGKTYAIKGNCWTRGKNNIRFYGNGARLYIPSDAAPTGGRPIAFRECNKLTIVGVWFDSDLAGACVGLAVENSSDVLIEGNIFEGFTSWGLAISEDTEYAQSLVIGDTATTAAGTLTQAGLLAASSSRRRAAYLYSERTFAPSDVDTGADTVSLPDMNVPVGHFGQIVTTTTVPGGLAQGLYYAVIGTGSAKQLALSKALALAGTAINLTTQGSGTHSFRPLHRAITDPTDFSLNTGTGVVTLVQAQRNVTVRFFVADACDNIRIVGNRFKDCAYYGLTTFPKVTSYNLIVADNYFENCGTTDSGAFACKAGQSYRSFHIHGNTFQGGKNCIAMANWETGSVSHNNMVNFTSVAIGITFSDHSLYDGTVAATEDYAGARLEMLDIHDNLIVHDDGMTGAVLIDCIRLNGTRIDGGRLMIRDNTIYGTQSGIDLRTHQAIPGIVIENNKIIDLKGGTSARPIVAAVTNGYAPAGLIVRGNEFRQNDLTVGTSNVALVSDGLLYESNYHYGVGTSVSLITLADGNGAGSARFVNNTFEECCPTATGTVAAINNSDTTSSRYMAYSGNKIRNGTTGGLTHFITSAGPRLRPGLMNDFGGLPEVNSGTYDTTGHGSHNIGLYGSATFNPGSLADGAGETTTVTVTGAALGDFAFASFSLDTSGITITAWVSAANTVSVRFQNESGGVLDIASGTLRVRVLKN